MLKTLTQKIADRLKVSFPAPDEHGHYSFSFNNDLKVSLLQYEETIVLSSELRADIKQIEEKNQLGKVLQWQLARAKENDEILSFDPDTQKLFLYKQLPPSKLSEHPIDHHLQEFLNNLEYWNIVFKEKLANTSHPFPR